MPALKGNFLAGLPSGGVIVHYPECPGQAVGEKRIIGNRDGGFL